MSPRRVLPKALVEMLVIIASILMAFALDAWWAGRQEAQEGTEIQAELVEEFRQAAEEISFSIARNQRIIAAADTLLLTLRGSTGAVDVSAGTLGALLLTPTTDPRRGTLDALIASGRLDLMGERNVQGLLADWPAALEDVREEELAAKRFVHEQLTPYLGRMADLSAVFQWRLVERRGAEEERHGRKSELALPTATVHLRVTGELINMIETRRYLASYTLTNFSPLTETLQTIREALDE